MSRWHLWYGIISKKLWKLTRPVGFYVGWNKEDLKMARTGRVVAAKDKKRQGLYIPVRDQCCPWAQHLPHNHKEICKHDETFYPLRDGADVNDDWTDPEVWKKANPSLGITIGLDKVQTACDSARQNPGEENAFRQLCLNQWVNQVVRWMSMEKWGACAFTVNP